MRPKQSVNSRDVARLAGVSQSTVSKVINNSAVLTAETRARVIQAAQTLGYSLTAHKNKYQMALIFPGNSISGYIGDMLTGLLIEMEKRNISVEIVSDKNLGLLNERCVDCAITFDWRKEFFDIYNRTVTLPLVRINGASNHLNDVYSVLIDGIGSMQNLIRRLWKLGHRKIGFFFFDPLEHELDNQAKRQEGFLLAMRSYGVENPEQFCTYDCTNRSNIELIKLLKSWYDDGITALIFANSAGTTKMFSIINALNIKVPGDLTLVGWEDEVVSPFTTPPLSTFYPDPYIQAKAAVDLAEKIITRQKNISDVILPYQWIERKSIAPPRIKPPDANT